MKHYIGIDFHKQFSQVAVMNEKGDIIVEEYYNILEKPIMTKNAK